MRVVCGECPDEIGEVMDGLCAALLEHWAALAAHHCDVLLTTGVRGGVAPTPAKLRALAGGLGTRELGTRMNE